MNNKMQWYPWLDGIYHQILSAYRNNKGHHALFFCNKWDNGADILIHSIICWLICSCPDKIRHCGSCHNCRLMQVGNHPNYYKIHSTRENKSIGIDAVRICIDWIYNYILKSKVKIIFIKYVEHLTDQAIHAFLKVLEEPPKNTYFFLLSQRDNRLPLTLLSRCIRWSITSPIEKIGLKWLLKQEKFDNIMLVICALRLCNGAPIEARNMLKSNVWEERMMLCRNLYNAVTHGDFLKILSSLNICCRLISLRWLITLILDAVKWQKKSEEKFLINLDQIELITAMSFYWNIFSLEKQLQQWLIVFRYLQTVSNVNYRLLLTYRLLNWKYNIVENYLNF